MQPTSLHFTGLLDRYTRRNPDRRLKAGRQDLANEAERKRLEEENHQWQELAGQIRDALAEELFQDKYGAFRGWDLLKLIPQNRVKDYYSRNYGKTPEKTIQKKLEGLADWQTAQKVLNKMVSLKLLECCYQDHQYKGRGYILSERGTKALKLFRKQFKKSWLPLKQGNFTFNPQDLQ